MSLSLNDYKDVAQIEKDEKAAAVIAQPAASAASAPASSGGGIRPVSNSSFNVDIPGLINQSWNAVSPYLNPIHYKEGKEQDYSNIDVPTTAVHGLVEGAVGLGLATKLKRMISGESAGTKALQEQTQLGRERAQLQREQFEYEKQQNSLGKQVEQKITAQAAGQPAPSRIEPTFASEPIGAVTPPPIAAPADVVPKPSSFSQGYDKPAMTYGATTGNAIGGVPNPLQAPAPIAPPEAAAPAMPNKAEREHQSWMADEQRKKEIHEKRMAADDAKSVVKAEKTVQNSQGQASFNKDTSILDNAEKVKVDKAMQAQGAVKPVAAIAPATISAPTVMPAAASVTPMNAPTSVAELNVTGPAIGSSQEVAKASTTTPTEDVSAVAGGNKPSAAKRRTAEQIMSDKTEQQFTGAKKQLLTNLGNQYGEDYSKAAHEALGIAKERLGKGEKFSMEPGTGKVTEHWAKMKANMLANPEAYPDITVKHIQKSVEQVKKEVAQKKAAESQRGGANVNAIGEAGSKVAGAVKPILGQTGALVGSELKGAAAMLPFMLATDVQAQNAGYRRELEQQMKTERNASRSAELKSELQKLDEEKYLKAMKRRYVDRNVPAQFRPQ